MSDIQSCSEVATTTRTLETAEAKFINIGEFVDTCKSDYLQLANQENFSSEQDRDNLLNVDGMCEGTLQEMEELFDVRNLIGDDEKILTSQEAMKENVDSNLECSKQIVVGSKNTEKISILMRNFAENPEAEHEMKRINFQELPRDIDENETIVVVQVYFPCKNTNIKHRKTYFCHGKQGTLLLNCEIDMLSNQTLSDLCDCIKCVNDTCYLPVSGVYLPSKKLVRGRMFFINGTFYDDTREPNAEIYSKEIIKWLNKKPRNFKMTESRSMSETKISDLRVQLNTPYLYLHQGNCEHIISFKNVRRIHPRDCHIKRAYPLITYFNRRESVRCLICMKPAYWQVANSKRCMQNPTNLCMMCHKCLHFDEDGKPICEFNAVFIDDFRM